MLQDASLQIPIFKIIYQKKKNSLVSYFIKYNEFLRFSNGMWTRLLNKTSRFSY